jgi:hypothetical protein
MKNFGINYVKIVGKKRRNKWLSTGRVTKDRKKYFFLSRQRQVFVSTDKNIQPVMSMCVQIQMPPNQTAAICLKMIAWLMSLIFWLGKQSLMFSVTSKLCWLYYVRLFVLQRRHSKQEWKLASICLHVLYGVRSIHVFLTNKKKFRKLHFVCHITWAFEVSLQPCKIKVF